jgi:hypothetical protein
MLKTNSHLTQKKVAASKRLTPTLSVTSAIRPKIQSPRTGDTPGMTFTATGTGQPNGTVTLTLVFTDPPPSGVTYGPYSVPVDASGNWSYSFTINEEHENSGTLTAADGTLSDSVDGLSVSADPVVTIDTTAATARATASMAADLTVSGYAAVSGNRVRYVLLTLESLDPPNSDGSPIACTTAVPSSASPRTYTAKFTGVTSKQGLLRAIWVTRREVLGATSKVVDLP